MGNRYDMTATLCTYYVGGSRRSPTRAPTQNPAHSPCCGFWWFCLVLFVVVEHEREVAAALSPPPPPPPPSASPAVPWRWASPLRLEGTVEPDFPFAIAAAVIGGWGREGGSSHEGGSAAE